MPRINRAHQCTHLRTCPPAPATAAFTTSSPICFPASIAIIFPTSLTAPPEICFPTAPTPPPPTQAVHFAWTPFTFFLILYRLAHRPFRRGGAEPAASYSSGPLTTIPPTVSTVVRMFAKARIACSVLLVMLCTVTAAVTWRPTMGIVLADIRAAMRSLDGFANGVSLSVGCASKSAR